MHVETENRFLKTGGGGPHPLAGLQKDIPVWVAESKKYFSAE